MLDWVKRRRIRKIEEVSLFVHTMRERTHLTPAACNDPAPLVAYSGQGSWHPMTRRGTPDISMSWVMDGFSSLREMHQDDFSE